MKILFTTRFRRSYKRLVSKNEQVKAVVDERLKLFSDDPRHSILKDHMLKESLAGYRAISIGYDLRALYRKEKETYVFFDIGTHGEVYG